MTTDPMEFFSEFIPSIFNEAMEELAEAAEGGNEKATRNLKDSRELSGALKFVLEGDDGGTIFLRYADGKLERVDDVPDAEVRAAVALPHEAIEIGLEETEGKVDEALPLIKKGIRRTPFALLEEFMNAEPMDMHFVMKDTPDFEEVRVKVAGGSASIPDDPTFTVTMDYAVFEDIKARKIKPGNIMGKVQMTGDFAGVMQMGMDMVGKIKATL